MTTKIAILSHHGLGDDILLTAPLKRFAAVNPDFEIHLFVLKRFGDTAVQLLSGLDFIEKVHPVLPDAWDDFSNYNDGLRAVYEVGTNCAKALGINVVKPLYCFRNGSYMSLKNHKILRFAKELGITYDGRDELRPVVVLEKSLVEKARIILSKYPKPHTLLHLQAGNVKKTITYDRMPFTYAWEGTTFEIGRGIPSLGKYHVTLGLPDMEFTKALVASVDRIVAIDSIVMHLGFALERPTTAIFTMTPITQVIPLWYPLPSEKVTLRYKAGCEEGLSKIENELEVMFRK